MRSISVIIFGLIGFVIWLAVAVFVLMMARKLNVNLYRSTTNKRICGVCGGIGEYFKVDPTLIRLAWVIVTLCTGSGIVAYIILALVMPAGYGRVGNI